MSLTRKISKHNVNSFIWHATFLAFAHNFMDIDTIIPAMLVEAGGTPLHIGLMAAILTGGSSFTQLFFAPLISNDPWKKKYLLIGINSRLASLLAVTIMLWTFHSGGEGNILLYLFIAISVFAVGGAFANVGYTDILGKSVFQDSRKKFFSTKQLITSSVVLISAFLATRVLNSREYPLNYAMMFLIGFSSLLIASVGFWRLKEVIPAKLKITSPKHYLQVMRGEIRSNKKIKYFLGFINTQGITVSFLPFIILYAKNVFETGSADTGKFLVFKVIGGMIISLSILLFRRVSKYRYLLYLNVFLSLSIPTILLISIDNPPFWLIFLIGGLVFAIYSITMNGVLLEISGNENRAIYTGLAGAGNILPAIFPLIGGLIIKNAGFTPFFILYMIIIASSLFFIYRLKCSK